MKVETNPRLGGYSGHRTVKMNGVMAMKWLEIVRFELVYQFGRRTTWFFFAVFPCLLIQQMHHQAIAALNGQILFNAPQNIAESSAIMSLMALLMLAAFAGDVATRDVQTRLEPLMHAAPVGRAAYLGGRFLGTFIVSALLLAMVPLAGLFTPLLHPGLTAEFVGPFRLAAYLESYFLLILPNAFVGTALLFALAMLARHTMGSYLGAATIMAGAPLIMGFVGNRMGNWDLAGMLDSTGVTVLSVIGRTWSPVELNERLIGSAGALLWNRLLWLSIAVAALLFTYKRFQFGGNAHASPLWWQRGRLRAAYSARHDIANTGLESVTRVTVARSHPVTLPAVEQVFSAAGRVRQTLSVTRDSVREMATAWSWLVLPYLFFQVALTLGELNTMASGTPVLPTTGLILTIFSHSPPSVLSVILMLSALFAGELVWRERDANMQALADIMPVPEWVRFLGKLLGLWLIIILCHALVMMTGVASQLLRGWHDYDLDLYVKTLFGLKLVDALVFSALALSVHVLVNQKHVGHLVVILLTVGVNLLAPALGIEHPLLLYGAEPRWRHSAISGFGPFLDRMVWFDLYWSAWAMLLALVAGLFWVRGVERKFSERLSIALRRLNGPTAGAIATALGLVLLIGGYIFYNTNILNANLTDAEKAQRKAEYERRYGGYARVAQPALTATELNVEIFPDKRQCDVRGVHHLVNRTAQPINTIHVAVSSEVHTGEVEFDRSAKATLLDKDLGHRIYVLNEPLQPGEELKLSWQLYYKPLGFPARGSSTAIVANGSFIVMEEWMPLIGYQRGRELSTARERQEHNLPLRPAIPSLDDLQACHDLTGRERINLKVTVGTAAGQIAIAPGELRRTWTREGRRYFDYATSAPIPLGYAIFSAEYAMQEARWGDIAIEVLHHPGHHRNVQRMIRSIQASLQQFTERFGPYPHKVLRMIEYPASGDSLHSEPTTIWFSERFSLLDPASDERKIDLPFAVVSHEVAHQFQPSNARIEGWALLTESFAWYAALGVIQQEHGADHLQRFLGFMRESYLTPRSRADVPLLRATDWFLAYRKGPFAMHALREYIGQDKVDLAWRRLRAQHATGEPPFATSLDLYRELRKVTPEPLHYLLGDLLERNTYWELKASQARTQQTATGEWQVSLDVVARKVVVDTAGTETEVAMNDQIEIGIFAPSEAGKAGDMPLYRAMHPIRTGPQKITITIPRRPARAGIDPRHLLIDVEPGDNLADIRPASPSTD